MALLSKKEMELHEACTTLQPQLVEAYPQYSKIWVQYSRPSKKRDEYNIILTLFPHGNGRYRMLFNKGSRGITFEITTKMVEDYIRGMN